MPDAALAVASASSPPPDEWMWEANICSILRLGSDTAADDRDVKRHDVAVSR